MFITKKSSVVILVLLVISLCFNIFLISYICYKNIALSDKSIIGTYCTGDGKSEDDMYFCFTKEGRYVFYKQFNLVETGEYMTEDNNIYLLGKNEFDKEQYVIFNDKNSIYYVDSLNIITHFYRISDSPTYVNIPRTDVE